MQCKRMSVWMSAIATAVWLMCLVGYTHAAHILVSGNSMNHSNTNLTGAIAGLGHTAVFVAPGDFAATSLTGFDAIWLDGFSQYGTGAWPQRLLTFMNTGGNVLVQSPGFGSEGLAFYPLGTQLATVFTCPLGQDMITIVDALSPLGANHAVNAGLTNAGLSQWGASACGYFSTIGTFHGLTHTGTVGQWGTIVTAVGAGYLVYTQQVVSQYLSSATNPGATSQAARFLDNVVTLTNIQPSHTLTVTKTGTGTGTVSSTPAGITCGADCTEVYADNTVVTLAATPVVGALFGGWSGHADCSDGAVRMNAAKTCTATFTLGPKTLTVTKAGTGTGTVSSAPAGINCGADCTEAYPHGTVVTLTATPAVGSAFGGWSGHADCGDGAVRMNAAKTCTATFTRPPQTLTVTKAGTGTGTVSSAPAGISCGADCTEAYPYNTVVVLTPTPAVGSAFGDWSGHADCGDGAVRMNAAKTCTATFNPASPQTLMVTKAGTGTGTVSSVPAGISCGADCTQAYPYNTVVVLTPTPAVGSAFGGWSGHADCGDGAVRMNAAKTCAATFVALGPSLVSTSGRQLIVRRRNPDGTLALAMPYLMRGVTWSPASPGTATTPTDPQNTTVRRPEFGLWGDLDIPLIAAMQANTVLVSMDFGVDALLGPRGLALLNAFYHEGIMVVMTVDEAINDLARVQQAVNFYKAHPAILMWMLGNEWNINRYFGVASSVDDAARRTEVAAALIKTLDLHHPVATSYGEIDINAEGLRLADTERYVNTLCPSVDVWGLNIYRGRTFGSLFAEWAALSTKPMFLGEFGTDAFRTTAPTFPPQGAIDEAMQAEWTLALWNHLFRNLSAHNAATVAVGGAVFAWNDEWWKVAPAGSQQTGGFVLPYGHPDGFANEEYWGIVTMARQSRQLYTILQSAFDPLFIPPPLTIAFHALSRGGVGT